MELRYIVAFLTLISSTKSAQREISKKILQALPVDFYRVLTSGVENPHAELRSPASLELLSERPAKEQAIQINVTKNTKTRRRNQNSRIKMRLRSLKKKTKSVQLNAYLDPHQAMMSTTNWTGCEELDKRPYFHPDMVIDMDWVPLYAWSLYGVDHFVHRFTVPTVTLVTYYKSIFGKYLSSPVDWSQPRLLLSMLIKEKLLIADGRRGKFKVIEKFEMPEDVPPGFKIPVTTIQLKLKGNYLVMMCCDCEKRYTVLLGDPEAAPRTVDERVAVGQAAGIQGLGTPVVYDADDEQLVRRAMRDQETDLKEKKNSFLKGDFAYDAGSDVGQGGSNRKITVTGDEGGVHKSPARVGHMATGLNLGMG